MEPRPETTVGMLAEQLGVPAAEVMSVCEKRQILVWSAATPLDQREAELVWLTLRPPPPPPASESFGAAPASQSPPVAWTMPGAPAAPPPPPASGPIGPAGPPPPAGPPEFPTQSVAPWATTPTRIGTYPPPPRSSNRTGWIVGGVCVSAVLFLMLVGVLVGSIADDPAGDPLSVGGDTSTALDPIGPAPAEGATVDPPVLEIPDYDSLGQTEGRPDGFGEFEIGDCVNLPDGFLSDDSIETQTVFPRPVDCQEAHNAEVFQVGEFDAPTDSLSPGGEELFFAGGDACFESFLAYIHTGFDDHDFVVLVPLDQQWEQFDERAFTCFAYRLDAGSTVGSMRDRANS